MNKFLKRVLSSETIYEDLKPRNTWIFSPDIQVIFKYAKFKGVKIELIFLLLVL